jgi:predicted kinase
VDRRVKGKGGFMLYMVCGLPGTGKTTVAKQLASLTGGIVLRTDEIRRQILDDPKYTPEEKKKVYDAMFKTAESMLRTGIDIILDATFYKRERREEAMQIAKKSGKKIVIIEVKCDESQVSERLKKRKGDLSDADFEVGKAFRGCNGEGLFEKTAGINTRSQMKNS